MDDKEKSKIEAHLMALSVVELLLGLGTPDDVTAAKGISFVMAAHVAPNAEIKAKWNARINRLVDDAAAEVLAMGGPLAFAVGGGDTSDDVLDAAVLDTGE